MEQIITESPYLCSPNILWHPDCQTKAVALDFAGTGGCIKAGSPISAAGKVANDATAVGVLLHNAHELCCTQGLVVIGGYIKTDVAAENSGIKISDAARAAMGRLAFIGADGVPQPAAGGGGGNFIITVTQIDTNLDADKTMEEINAAFASGKTIMLRTNMGGSADTYFPLTHADYKDNGDCGYHFDSIMLMSSNLYLMRLYIGIVGVSQSLYQLTATSVE